VIEWGVVAAFVGPLIGAIGGVAAWFAWLGKRRDSRVATQIHAVTERLDLRITQVESTLANQTRHLDKQDEVLNSALQAIARIEGRLSGPVQVTTREVANG
jgi:uncharacterized YccA/Bax inhibitor family protein